jgi:hypothetical protein
VIEPKCSQTNQWQGKGSSSNLENRIKNGIVDLWRLHHVESRKQNSIPLKMILRYILERVLKKHATKPLKSERASGSRDFCFLAVSSKQCSSKACSNIFYDINPVCSRKINLRRSTPLIGFLELYHRQ